LHLRNQSIGETHYRYHFEPATQFLATKLNLITSFSREKPSFDDETQSRYHFEPTTLFFGEKTSAVF